MYLIPLDSTPNKSFSCLVPVDGVNRSFSLHLAYNLVGEYWTMDIGDADTGEALVTALPLLSGEYPAANLLEQWACLGIGSAVIVPIGIATAESDPDLTNLGADYALVWSDTQ